MDKELLTAQAHTTAPWKLNDEVFDSSVSEDHHGFRVVYGGGRDIAYCLVTSDVTSSASAEDKAECLANARLIAAAPELLKACTQLVSDLRSISKGEAELTDAVFHEHLATAEFSIAEAKGKVPDVDSRRVVHDQKELAEAEEKGESVLVGFDDQQEF